MFCLSIIYIRQSGKITIPPHTLSLPSINLLTPDMMSQGGVQNEKQTKQKKHTHAYTHTPNPNPLLPRSHKAITDVIINQ